MRKIQVDVGKKVFASVKKGIEENFTKKEEKPKQDTIVKSNVAVIKGGKKVK